MKKKDVKLGYFRCKVMPQNKLLKTDKTLEVLMNTFLQNKTHVIDRLRPISQLDNDVHVIPQYQVPGSSGLFAPLVELSGALNPQIESSSLSSQSIELKALYDEFENAAMRNGELGGGN